MSFETKKNKKKTKSEEARRADRALQDSIMQQFMIVEPIDDENSPRQQ
jgi:hypothetical protein